MHVETVTERPAPAGKKGGYRMVVGREGFAMWLSAGAACWMLSCASLHLLFLCSVSFLSRFADALNGW